MSLVNSLFAPLIVVRLSVLLYIIIIIHYIHYVNTFYFFLLFVRSLYRTTVHCVKNMCLSLGAFASAKSCKAMNTAKCGAVLSPPRLANGLI